MSQSKSPLLLELVVVGFLAAAQSSAPPPSPPGAREEALQLMVKGQFADARRIVTILIDDAKRTGSPLGYQAGLWHLLASTESRLGRYEEAKAALNRALQLSDNGRAAAHETAVALLVDLTNANLNQGDLEEANAALRRAMGIASMHLRPDHPRLGAVHHSLGVLFWMQGQLSRAEKAFRRAVTILEGSLGPDNADLAAVMSGLAGLLTMTARHADAIPLHERSKTILERIHGPAHPDAIGATFALGVALMKSAPERAELLLRQALANWRLSQPDQHPHIVKFLSALATSRYAQGDYREAGILSERALQMSRDIFGPEHPKTVSQIYEHSQRLRSTRRGKEAATLKKDADRIRALKGYGESDRHRVDILALH
jgi:tetratricopeptide (TPR) repeat protein